MKNEYQQQRNRGIVIAAFTFLVLIIFFMYTELKRLGKVERENENLQSLVKKLRAETQQPTAIASVSDTAGEPIARVSLLGEKPGVTMNSFSRLKTGMTYLQVVTILGKEGAEMSNSEIAGIKTVMYQWQGETSGANMNAMFQSGKLISKAQFGLK